MSLSVVRTVSAVRELVSEARVSGLKTCVVPTMGGLHEGHLSLVKKAGEVADFVIVTIFVNPAQFNNPEDLETYPGDETEDIAALEGSAADVVYAPNPEEMYPDGFATNVSVNAATDILCDLYRPGHFDGVTTVVAKLFTQTVADYACFGEKDYQQLFLVTRLARDLDLPIEIVPVDTVREPDGLALSSRNRKLSPEDRLMAPELNREMRAAAKRIASGEKPAEVCLAATNNLERSEKFKPEYFELRSTETLELLDEYKSPARLFAAAWLGGVRLIDNIPV